MTLETTEVKGNEVVNPTAFQVLPMTPIQKRSRYDQLLSEGKQRSEQEYIDKLRAEGKQIYTAEEVAARFGIEVSVTWVQKDLQRLMAIGDVVYPLRGLHFKASELHKLFVQPGRDGMRAILAEVYSLYMTARNSPDLNDIGSELVMSLDKKYRKNSTIESVFIRYVFSNLGDKQVHVYGKSLEYCFFKNVAVDDFEDFMRKNGGFEGIRVKALEELPKSDEQVAAVEAAKVERVEDEQIVKEYWDIQRANATVIDLGDVNLGHNGDHELAMRCSIKDGKLRVSYACTLTSTLEKGFMEWVLQAAKDEGKSQHKGQKTISAMAVMQRYVEAAKLPKEPKRDPLYHYNKA